MILYLLILLIPTLAITVCRLHDTGRSGWTYLLGLIPGIGFIIMIVLLCQKSYPWDNKWGPYVNRYEVEQFNASSDPNTTLDNELV